MRSKKVCNDMMFWFIALFFIGVAVCSFYFNTPLNEDEKVYDYGENWNYVNEESVKTSIGLPLKLEGQPNQTIVITKILPKIKYPHMMLCFRSAQQDVDVHIDGELIYHYDSHENAPLGKASYPNWNFIKLPRDYSGKEIAIMVTSPYEKFSGKFSNIKIGTETGLRNHIVNEHLPQYLLGIILIFFGSVFLVICFVARLYRNNFDLIEYIAAFAALAGLWIHAESKMLPGFMFNSFTENLIAFNSIMLCPLPFILFIRENTQNKMKPLLTFAFAVFVANFVGINLLQFLKIKDYIETLFISHILLILLSVFCIYVFCFRWNHKRSVFENLGMIFIVVGAVGEILMIAMGQTNLTGRLLQTLFIVSVFFISIDAIIFLLNRAKETVFLKAALQEKQAYIIASQMKPHFIYNTLGAIRSMIKTQPDDACKMITYFSKYLRASITDKESADLVPFAEELAHIKAYCEIQKYRFKGKVNVEYNIETENFFVPPISIQPLVENAIQHGLCQSENGGTVTVSTKDQTDCIVVIIQDDGVGFSYIKSVPTRDHIPIGLKNSKRRLHDMLGASIGIQSEKNVGSIVTVTIPKDGGNENGSEYYVSR